MPWPSRHRRRQKVQDVVPYQLYCPMRNPVGQISVGGAVEASSNGSVAWNSRRGPIAFKHRD